MLILPAIDLRGGKCVRLKQGDCINITNGNGSLFLAELIEVHHKKCLIAVNNETVYTNPKDFSLHMAVAPTKNMDRMEWFVEKAVELGINEITPIICTRSERKEIKKERLVKVAISAMKQSLKFHLPQINEAVVFNEFVSKTKVQNSFICFGEAPESNNLHQFNTAKQHNLFLIGPEGDFTPKEIITASEKNYKPLNLGKSRLRTETAAIHIVSLVSFQQCKVI